MFYLLFYYSSFKRKARSTLAVNISNILIEKYNLTLLRCEGSSRPSDVGTVGQTGNRGETVVVRRNRLRCLGQDYLLRMTTGRDEHDINAKRKVGKAVRD